MGVSIKSTIVLAASIGFANALCGLEGLYQGNAFISAHPNLLSIVVCKQFCIDAPTCLSYQYNAVIGHCNLFSTVIKPEAVVLAPGSNFFFYDTPCPVGNDPVSSSTTPVVSSITESSSSLESTSATTTTDSTSESSTSTTTSESSSSSSSESSTTTTTIESSSSSTSESSSATSESSSLSSSVSSTTTTTESSSLSTPFTLIPTGTGGPSSTLSSSVPFPMSNSTIIIGPTGTGSATSSHNPLTTPITNSPTQQLTTSTIYATNTYTITSCAPTVTNCPYGSLTTVTVAVSTTICPITAHLLATSYFPSTIYATTTSTISSCAPTITNCPYGSVTTSTKILYEILCPVVVSTMPNGQVSTITITQPSGAAFTPIAASNGIVVSNPAVLTESPVTATTKAGGLVTSKVLGSTGTGVLPILPPKATSSTLPLQVGSAASRVGVWSGAAAFFGMVGMFVL